MTQSYEICDVRKGDLIIITAIRGIRDGLIKYDYPVIVLAMTKLWTGYNIMCLSGSNIKSWVMYEGFDSVNLLRSIDDVV